MVQHGRLRSQERKVATVLFADLAESTSLGERLDIEPLAQVMGAFHRAVREVVERCEGSAESVGDGVVAIFGAPVAVENHHVSMSFDGHMETLLNAVSGRYTLIDITTQEADLEEIFLTYYRDEGVTA